MFRVTVESVLSRPRLERLLILGVLAASLWMNFSVLLTNEFTPRGDGARIVPYVEFMRAAETPLPLWNPWKLGGVPTLATPERYAWVAMLIDPSSASANLQLNLALLAVGLLILGLLYKLSRTLGLGESGAMFGVLVFANCYIFQGFVLNGRINGMQALCVTLLASMLYVMWVQRGRPWTFALCAVLTGHAIVDMTPYVLVTYYPLIFGYHVAARWSRGAARAVAAAVAGCGAVSLLGIAAYAVFFLPQFGHLFGQLSSYPTLTTLSDWLSLPLSLPGLFLPVFYSGWAKEPDHLFPYLSAALLPLLVMALGQRLRPRSAGMVALSVWLLAALGIMAATVPGAFDLVQGFSKIPVLQHIRHNFGLLIATGIAGALIVGHAYERLRAPALSGAAGLWLPGVALLAVFVVGGVLQMLVDDGYRYHGVGLDTLWKQWRELPSPLLVAMLAFAALLCVPYTRFASIASVRLYLLMLVLLQPWLCDFTDIRRTSSNRSPFPAIAAVLRDDTSYFRLWDASYRPQQMLEMPRVRNFSGYSKFFSEEHRRAYSGLLGHQVTALRPTWVFPRVVAAPNPAVLERLNIKYVILNRHHYKRLGKGGETPFVDRGWTRRVIDGDYSLWQRDDWRPQLFVTHHAVGVMDAAVALARAEQRRPGSQTIFVEGPSLDAAGSARPARAELVDFSENHLAVEVDTPGAGYLFLSEYFAPEWRAWIDGVPAELVRADGVFRALRVPAGSARVEMRYEPPNLYLGAVVSAATLALLVPGTVLLERRRRRRAGPSGA